ncbi:uncharacterized protein LOC106140418 [Amyelois transitella]|uniref:uncharacterized protein LOC106140418 n=1 Tax=Amyelois transitella TaxID=680683 RepID=UPI00298F6109|nr:uncharacterized protein LOC106140418 [Amyelois transitella]XP_060808709.1 uncharacterized protein LOC106140418 [Amyelois transitella]
MATHSSSESWSAAGGANVVDLDKLMRGVRPHRHAPAPIYNRNGLVVDNGGLPRKPGSSSSSGSSTPRVVDPTRGFANKRFSHDSGVSDGSYVKRRSRPHRRLSIAESNGITTKRELAARPSGSAGSVRALRAACERALRDQQRQLARMTKLCERLGDRRGERRARSDTERTKTDSSDLSSSSCSTRDPRRKDKNRAQECKTYKIIMSKLDELNRVFLSRRSPLPSPARRRAPSTASVTVSNKLVATDDHRGSHDVSARQKVVTRRVETEARQLVERAVGETPSERNERAEQRSRLANLRAVNNAYALDIAPQDAVCKYPNIATESVVKRSSDEGSRSTLGDPRFGFPLDDPVQLYAQAKRLQALHMSSRRARSSAPPSTSRGGAGAGRGAGGGLSGSQGVSLCALCREYWRAVRGYFAAQVCCPQDDIACACS